MGAAYQMGTKPVGRLLARFSLPAICGFLLTRGNGLAEGALVGGTLGHGGIAVLTIAAPLVVLLRASVMLVGDGGATLCSLRLGTRDTEGAARACGNAIVLALAAATVALGCVAAFGRGAFVGVAGSPEALDAVCSYAIIVAAGMFPLGFSLGMAAFLRASGFPGRTLAVQVVEGACSLAFMAIIAGLLGGGVAGMAVALVLGQTVAAVVTVGFLVSSAMPFTLALRHFRPDRRTMGRILALGGPSFIVRSFEALLSAIVNGLAVGWAAVSALDPHSALAAVGVIDRVGQFALASALGIAVGGRTLWSYNRGAGLAVRVRKLLRWALAAAVGALSVAWVVIAASADGLASAFGLVGNEAELAAHGLRIACAALPCAAFRVVGINYFQGTGAAVKANALAVAQKLLVQLPLVCAVPVLLPLAVPISLVEALFWAMALADVASSLLVGAFLLVAAHPARLQSS